MKVFISALIFMLCFSFLPESVNAMWAKLSDYQLIENSEVIIVAELTEAKEIIVQNKKIMIGILKAKEVLKGEKQQNVFMLELPSTATPLKSDDIFYKKGQKGIWYLRKQNVVKDYDIYSADHPQRFLPSKDADDKLKALRTILP